MACPRELRGPGFRLPIPAITLAYRGYNLPGLRGPGNGLARDKAL